MEILILFAMLFCHIVDDYYLQGILADLKQRAWWVCRHPTTIYKRDYIAALAAHGFSWAFMIMLPFGLWVLLNSRYNLAWLYGALVIANTIVHGFVDDLKCNKYKINLLTDQTIHVAQVITTWMILVFVV